LIELGETYIDENATEVELTTTNLGTQQNLEINLKESLVLDEFVNDSTADLPGQRSPFKTLVIAVPNPPESS
jgi:hypothetical protein